MEKRDKRVVGAAVAAAIVIVIAVLAVGWFVSTDGDTGPGAGDPTATAPAGADSDGIPPATTAPAATTDASTAPPPSQAAVAGSTTTGAAGGQTPASSQPSSAGVAEPAQTAPGGTQSAIGNLLTSPAADGPASSGTAPAQDTMPTAGGSTTEADTAASAPSGGQTVLTDEQVAALPPIRAPSFDVVRVNELGDAVIAGRAEPRSVVIIYDGDREIGRVAADSRGEWVFVSDRPLVPGQHEIGLLSQSGPQSRLSEQVVVLIAPEPRQDIAGQPSEGDREREKPLALLVPRDEIGATTVLQSPPAVAGDDPAAVASSATMTPSGTPSGQGTASGSASDSAAEDGAPVSIDVVDYDESGRLIVSGRSTPQSDVRLYLDNEYVGTARTDSDGSFQVQPTAPVEPGVYALRVDEVDPVGSVMARAETPFQRASEVEAVPPGYSRVIVQPGNSLWRLARRVYGQGIQYTVIYQANSGQIRNPDLIYPGQIFNVPEMPKDVPAGDPS